MTKDGSAVFSRIVPRDGLAPDDDSGVARIRSTSIFLTKLVRRCLIRVKGGKKTMLAESFEIAGIVYLISAIIAFGVAALIKGLYMGLSALSKKTTEE